MPQDQQLPLPRRTTTPGVPCGSRHSHMTTFHSVRWSHDPGKMAALTAENFAALQSLLKVKWEGGDGVSRAFVPEILDGTGIGINGP